MTDRRTAALAKAHHEAHRLAVPGATGSIAVEWQWLTDAERAYEMADAVAILAALPPGWCGHETATDVAKAVYEGVEGGRPMTDEARLRAVADFLDRVDNRTDAGLERFRSEHRVDREMQRDLRAAAATIARLRRIEEAARAVHHLDGFVFAGDDKERVVLAQSVVRRILRAALGAPE